MGTSRRIRMAMWIRHVPSSWKAEAMAMRPSPESCKAHRTISSGAAFSNRALRSRTRFSASSVSIVVSRRVSGCPGSRPREYTQRPRAHFQSGKRPRKSSVRPLCYLDPRRRKCRRPHPQGPNEGAGVSTNETIPPHGGTLVNLIAHENEAARQSAEAEHLPKVTIGRRELSDLEMMAVGALSPLTGFMGEKDYRSVLEEMHLENGLPWTIPVTLSFDEAEAKRIGGTSRVALVSEGSPIALVEGEQIYRRDREAEAQSVFGTTDAVHPGVAALNEAGDYVVAGQVRVIRLRERPK